MSLSHYSTSKPKPTPSGPTEFEILKSTHKFLREDDEKADSESWDEKMAAKYYASLYREFAVCDLKHYKSGEFALRWRTENEVLSGAGESTCGNTRCKHHEPSRYERNEKVKKSRGLTTLELPFAYAEHGENKSALVKVVLCEKCVNKLMWKRRKAKELEDAKKPVDEVKKEVEEDSLPLQDVARASGLKDDSSAAEYNDTSSRKERTERWINRRERGKDGRRRRSGSRSQSPKRGNLRSQAQHHRS